VDLASLVASHDQFPWATFWAAAAAVTGVAAIIVAVVLWRIGAPRRLITYDVPVVTSLLAARVPKLVGPAVKVDVLVNGDLVADPYFMELRMQVRSRRDIRASDFDQDRPLVFQLGATVVGGIGYEGTMPIIEEAGKNLAGSVLAIYPRLIRRGDGFRTSLLLDGKPRITVQNSLVNVDVWDQPPRRRPPWLLFVIGYAFAVQIPLLTFLGIRNSLYLSILIFFEVIVLGLIALGWRFRRARLYRPPPVDER
jgi:hypothetical protein